MIIIIVSLVAVVVCGLAYMVGLLDRPKFAYREYLLRSKQELYVLAAPCQEPSFPKHIPRICEGTQDAVHTLHDATKLLADGAALYDVPEGAERLCIGLFYDDPSKTDAPRWAIGWVVAAKDFATAQALAEEANKHRPEKLKERFVAVRVGPKAGVAGRIKWRVSITPMVVPTIMWSRAFAAYKNGGYISNNGRVGDEGSVACEVYVMGPNGKGAYIDYVVLSGDTKNVWDDAFPVESK